jgi:DNA invertase Pin-like site-specific DNA recombinase
MQAKAYSYLRFSTPEQARGDSFRRQRELAVRYAAAENLDLIDASYEDLGISAFRGSNARGGALAAFLRAIDDRVVRPGSFLLVESLDRVSRQDAWDALPLFQQIVNAGVTIVTLQDGRTYSRASLKANPYLIFESLLVMVRANEESATKSRRGKAAWEAKRAQASAGPMTARVPAWLRVTSERPKTFEVIEARADVVRRIFELALSGKGQHAIAALLDSEGAPTFGDSQGWHRSYVKKILGNAAVIGDFTPHVIDYSSGKRVRRPLETISGYFPPVVDRAQFERVQSLYADNTTPHAHGELRNLSGGLLRCPHCASTMTRVAKGPKGGKPRLVCTNAKRGRTKCPSVTQEIVEQAIVSNSAALLSNVPTAAGDLAAELAFLKNQIGALDAAIERLSAAVEHGDYRPEPAVLTGLDALRNEVRLQDKSPRLPHLLLRLREYEKKRAEAESKLRKIEEKLATVSGPSLGRRLKELSSALVAKPLDYGKSNALLRELFSVISFDRQFNQITFNWRHGGQSCFVLGDPML